MPEPGWNMYVFNECPLLYSHHLVIKMPRDEESFCILWMEERQDRSHQ